MMDVQIIECIDNQICNISFAYKLFMGYKLQIKIFFCEV
jgi:hypothetical protein